MEFINVKNCYKSQQQNCSDVLFSAIAKSFFFVSLIGACYSELIEILPPENNSTHYAHGIALNKVFNKKAKNKVRSLVLK